MRWVAVPVYIGMRVLKAMSILTKATGMAPIYRYYDGSDHFFTLFPGNYPSSSSEGIAGYASSSNVAGTIPIHRYVNPNNNEHFYTKVYFNPPVYSYEGVAWYAYQ